VAEGVETQHDWDLLRELGCNLAQGYFIAKPMPAEEFLSRYMYR
jgi:EAL domain-containing protein (putative c-di-GMP-specific phosphodiesterase class I)